MANSGRPDERSLEILRLLINQYICKAQPVSSKTLADHTDLGLSSASIRHIMADLERAGYLCSPHTSAGRIPTQKGYRLFVDSLLTSKPLSADTVESLTAQLSSQDNQSTAGLLRTTSGLLSDITKLACIVSMPRKNQLNLQQIEFLPLSENRILAVLVFSGQEVQNRVLHTERVYSSSELQQAANFINQHYIGMNLKAMRKKIVETLKKDQGEMNELMRYALNMANLAVRQKSEGLDYIVSGQERLLYLPDMEDINRLRSLFDTFAEKRAILYLLDKCLETNSIQIFIGKEAGLAFPEDCSIVTAPYELHDNVLGVLSVIGPSRMDYSRIISVMNVTSKLLSVASSGVKKKS